MITLGTVKFNFLTDDEPFALRLNGRWDAFFTASFERVVDEVLSAYDTPERMITIDSLSLDMGTISKDDFDRHFATRLREALKEYMRKWTTADSAVALQAGVHLETVERAALDILCFYLLHGYLPNYTTPEYTDLHLLLAKAISESAYRFREFLESYGHYDFLCRRLVFSFTDDELEEIVRVVQPSESKFVNLYVRVQLRSYHKLERADIAKDDYRNVVWTLVLAYLFAESRTRFSRKQIMMHTLRGVAAHFNFKFAEIAQLMTESVQTLEHTVAQLPELWSLLKEIRQDVKAELYALNGDYRRHLLHEILFALQAQEKGDTAFVLSNEHVRYVLSNPTTCRELLRRLQEPQIHRLVGIIVPPEKEYVIGYSRFLDKNKDSGTFTGKAGSDFRVLKWEFIFAVLLSMPASAFSRKYFVLSVVQRLAAHYNLTVGELIRLLASEEEWKGVYLSPELLLVLQALDSELNGDAPASISFETLSSEECEALLQTPALVRLFVRTHTEQQMVIVVTRLLPAHSQFVVGYASLLDKGHDAGMLRGKAGNEFTALKWEFIFSCLFIDRGVAFNQKRFVHSVLQQLAAHYNVEVRRLVSYFLQNLSAVLTELPFAALRTVLQELYKESFFAEAGESTPHVNEKSDKEMEQWALHLFGTDVAMQTYGRETILEKWLIYFLNERNAVIRNLWRAGRLNTPLVLLLINRTPTLRNLWLHRIGDQRLLAIYRRWRAVYTALSSRYREYGFLEPAGEYLSVWMVELTSRSYSAWSEAEIIRFLTARLQQTIPPGLASLIDKIQPVMGKELTEIIKHIEELKNEEMMDYSNNKQSQIEMNNAGLVLIAPFLPMLFQRTGYLIERCKKFKDTESKIHAVFLLQYLVYGEQREWPETELFLNKLLIGMEKDNIPLPRSVMLKEEDINTAKELLNTVCQHWEQMRHTSAAAFQTSFLERQGNAMWSEENERWEIKVAEKAYDVLLEYVPWPFRMIRLPFMQNTIEVKWR